MRFFLNTAAVAMLVLTVALPLWGWARRRFYPAKVTAVEAYTVEPVAKKTVDHSVFDQLLKKYVVKGRVDYAKLKLEQDALRGYLKSLETIQQSALSRDEVLGLFVNAYNAATLELILEHYPGLASIKDIPAEKRWDDVRWTIAGELVSLSELEHDILRKRFEEPRIHFAINCASIGCPPLRSEVYTGANLEAQLQDQGLAMNRDFGGAKWDGTTLRLSKIYDWFEDDFTRHMELKNFVAQYMAPGASDEVKQRAKVRIEFQDYNWALNGIRN